MNTTHDGLIIMMHENGVGLLRTEMTKNVGESYIVRSDRDTTFVDYEDAMDLYIALREA